MVSHELRTPLARIRVAVELMESPDRPDLRGRIERDIEELDGLIGELLMNSRLDSPELELESEPVELLALLAEVAPQVFCAPPSTLARSPTDSWTQASVAPSARGDTTEPSPKSSSVNTLSCPNTVLNPIGRWTAPPSLDLPARGSTSEE